MHSSQNEQDNRAYAKFAKVPLLEPSDSQEAYDFVAEAFTFPKNSTRRSSCVPTRVSHGRGRVVRVVVDPSSGRLRQGHRQVRDGPRVARERDREALARLERLRSRAETTPLQRFEAGSADFGMIASGVAI